MNDCCSNPNEVNVIFFGLPGRLCLSCNTLEGLAKWVPEWLMQASAIEEGFMFYEYEGSYWIALKDWLMGRWA